MRCFAVIVVALMVTGVVAAADAPATEEGKMPSVPVGPATWRVVQAELDNVYTVIAVAKLRDEQLTKFLKAMTEADQKPLWKDRDETRKMARQALWEELAQLREIADKSDQPLAKQEASLAILELQYKSGDYKAVAQSREAILSLLPSGKLRAQADYYLIEGARRQGDAAQADALRRTFSQDTPSLNAFYDVTTLDGCLRQVVTHYEFAQGEDDMAVENPKEASQLRVLQEQDIVLASKLLDTCAPSVPRQNARTARDTTNDTTLPVTSSVSGIVVRSNGITAVPAALIMIRGASGKITASAVTDKEGRFSDIDLVPGSYNIEVDENGAPTAQQPLIIAKPTDHLSLTVQYSAASLGGVVKTAAGTPVPKAELLIFSPHAHYHVMTDNNGSYSVDAIIPGKYSVGVLAHGYKPCVEKEITVSNSPKQTRDYQLSELPPT